MRLRNKIVLALLIIPLCHYRLIAGDLVEESRATHRAALKRLAVIMPQRQSAHYRLDNEIARRWFDLFIDSFDKRRLYFTAGDIRHFSEMRDKLDEHARRGDLSFAIVVRDTYSKRLRQAARIGAEWLDTQHDFTIDERVELRPEGFAEDDEALRQRWRKWVKYELLIERAAGLAMDEAVDKLRARYHRIANEKRYHDDAELYELYLDTFVRSFDPHSQYLGRRSLVHFRL